MWYRVELVNVTTLPDDYLIDQVWLGHVIGLLWKLRVYNIHSKGLACQTALTLIVWGPAMALRGRRHCGV